jgi:putative transposase
MKNEGLGMDFVQDRTADGRPSRMMVVLDEYTRECLAIEVARQFCGGDIVAVVDELTAILGAPAHILADNGLEVISKAVKARSDESGTARLYIDPDHRGRTA